MNDHSSGGRLINKPHILFLTSYRFHIGGTERLVLELIKGLPAYRFTVVGPLSPQFKTRVLSYGGEVESWKARAWLDPLAMVKLFRILKHCRPSVLHVLDPRAGAHAWLCACALRVPILYNPPLPAYRYARSRVRRAVVMAGEKFFNHHGPARIVFVSLNIFHEAITLRFAPGDRTRVVQNGVDLERYRIVVNRSAYRRKWGTPTDAVVICFVGRLVPEKGVPMLLEAFKTLAPSHPKLWLWIVGDGPLRFELERLANALPEGNRIRFFGFREDIPEILRSSDLFVLPSLLEAMPLTVLEAMAAGLPAIVTSVGDNPSLVSSGINGICIPPGSQDHLVEAIQTLATNESIRKIMGNAAIKTAELYSIKKTVQAYCEIYDSMLNK